MLALAPQVEATAALGLPAAEESAEAAADEPAIAAEVDGQSDDRIARRITSIFTALPALEPVEVSVDGGVVTLSGTLRSAEDIERAEAIAGRVEGVVTVENALSRDVSLGGGFGLDGVRDKARSFIAMLPLIGAALLVWLAIATLGYLIAGAGRVWHRIAPNSFLAGVIQTAIRFAFVVGGLVVALDMLGASALLGAVLGGAGVIGLALGFAMRDTVENYVASLMLSLRQPFRANDHVLIDDLEGRVIRLTSRATVLMTLDGNHLRVPNATVFKAIILNYTRNPQRRFDFVLGVDADDDAVAARRLGVKVLGELPFVLGDPPPEARVEEVGDSNVVIRFLAWIDQREADFHKSRTRAIPAVKTALEDAGFGLPEPIYRLRFDPRSASLPFHDVPADEPTPAPAPSPTPATPAATDDHDVAPQDEIARMVEEDRRQGGEPDLLDDKRPVE